MTRPQAMIAALGALCDRTPWTVALAVISTLTAARIAVLFASGLELYGDEAQYWTYAEEMGVGYYSKPPMIAWLIGATTAVCGPAEACVRLWSPLLHGVAALVLFALARDLAGEDRTALWASLAYATLPGVSYSSLLASTDVPLLLCWSVALLALWRLRDGAGMAWVLALGMALGLGLHSKYAMAYLLPCLAIAAAMDRPFRALLASTKPWLAMALGVLVWSPNLWWNWRNGGATIAHVGENANLDANLFMPGEALEFIGAQFGIMGPVLFAAYLLRLIWVRRMPAEPAERFLIAFSLPMLAIITGQSLLFGGNANWAVTAFPAATVLVVWWLRRINARRWLSAALGIHGAVLAALVLFAVSPAVQGLPGARELAARLDGWRSFAAQVSERAKAHDAAIVLLDHRFMLAQLWYYGDIPPPRLRMWLSGSVSNHYEMTRRFDPVETRGRVLYVSRWDDAQPVRDLAPVLRHEQIAVTVADGSVRRYHLFLFPGPNP